MNSYIDKLNILFEDNHIIVVEKFPNVLSQGDITEDISMLDIVKEYIKVKYSKPGNVYLGLVHRLDRRVGGVMVFAKTSKAASRLSESIRNNEFNKHYYVLVNGCVDKDGEVNIKIKKDESNKAIISNDGKDSFLYYHVLDHINDNTLLDIDLITGRYNQIRVSMAYINHPIINDYKYSSLYKKNNDEIGLYCYEISFPHPITHEIMEFNKKPNGKIWQK